MDTLQAPAATGHTKQYVFVDEYNRHKRLKVMRACDGCRKRKIRCDGALQNGPWPCGACVRMKLKCIPPTLDPDDEQQASNSAPAQGQYTFQTTTPAKYASAEAASNTPQRMDPWPTGDSGSSMHAPAPSAPVERDINAQLYSSQFFHQQPTYARQDRAYQDSGYFTPSTETSGYQDGGAPHLLRTQTELSNSSGGDAEEVDASVKELSGQMGDLSIDPTSIAPYIANERKNLAETPAIGEEEVLLPPSVGTDTTVRIPPEMMPSEARAMDYFGYFFNYIHPYAPVLNRAAFYEQWRSARQSISPLLLESIFACVARYLDQPIEARRWLALAAKHEESFKDVPRLSTVQGMILLTKAREFVPRRGYFYRSWMTLKYVVTMGCDLGLNEHLDQHRLSGGCTFSRSECLVRTRIWQTLFGLEIMIGSPQGRTDFSVDIESVDLSLPPPSPDVDPFEQQTSRRFTYLAQGWRNIMMTTRLWLSMRRYKRDWALDPSFIQHNEDIDHWLNSMPSDLRINYPADDSPPWLGNDHFLANVHVYQHLVLVMHHRPQLQALLERRDQGFVRHLDMCVHAAAMICKLHEALLRDFGLHGLHFMQRGINFTIYCVLSCAMLHLAAITSPDPDLNSRARTFFTRHMRVLEHCTSSAAVEMQAQINALREAFSTDTSKPFELKPSLGLRSPSMENQATPPGLRNNSASAQSQRAASWAQLPGNTSSKAISPSSEYPPQIDQVVTQSMQTPSTMAYPTTTYQMAPNSFNTGSMPHVTAAPQSAFPMEPVVNSEQPPAPVWDPSGIFQQWSTAFGGAPAPQPVPQPQVGGPRMSHASASGMHSQYSPTSQQTMYGTQQVPNSGAAAIPETTPPIPTVTPLMWQDAFTTAYVSGHGNKRYRDDGMDPNSYNQYKRRG
ncbi:hypothetical protein KC332_g8541 [Hortaea werneckii]|uniref:Zn(2)-C6 fungal-type domain-containing protein n=1 Tax=Hortaea werneckii EXF-2000 TaxID=1157616 RepID=A0A1Z5TCR0_HORWE|nr:hypothetical protein KC350_g16079 [Hortaea werneckii]OTA33768.1 hypothetical protein BTJ68_06994 [Hortaea werneckii EXF-2000]KAI6823942.1 hypothetical protein KC358_g8389 [Hortaea werneckii]KAI6925960.1 hypothetical protein KC348_g8833 [Hortaea werneckii]KAI6938851.1 hypothetical protein KC341_g4622 [Hortaea werneckii]